MLHRSCELAECHDWLQDEAAAGAGAQYPEGCCPESAHRPGCEKVCFMKLPPWVYIQHIYHIIIMSLPAGEPALCEVCQIAWQHNAPGSHNVIV